MNKRRWIQTGLLSATLIAAGFGGMSVKHHQPSNPSWVASVGNSLVSQGGSGSTTSTNTTTMANTTATLPSAGVPNHVAAGQTTGSSTSTESTPTLAHSTSEHGVSNGNGAASTPGAKAGPNATQAVPPAAPNLGTFTIVVSEDQGKTVLSRKTVSVVKGESLVDYMHQNFDVTTTYGDDFMLSINGVKSQWVNVPVSQRQPVDWFLYVNNTEAPVGPADVIPAAGDTDVWDYHRWDPSTGKG